MYNEPRVMMKAGSFTYAIMTPLTAPIATPIRTAARIPNHIFPVLLITFAQTTEANANTDPCPKSIPPVRITKVIPVAMMA
ncbi:hypothetical protein SDC9_205215 [bioreactor metagenome]|uniref:Uncharacterized protein n=1 Tax=bioreactor metagenome TaxID=1076179 RepID=A0A645J1Q7_9ZZZZ